MTIFDYKATLIEDEHDSLLYVYDAVVKNDAFYVLVYTLDDETLYKKKVPFDFDTDKKWKIVRSMVSYDYRYVFHEVFKYKDIFGIERFYQ